MVSGHKNKHRQTRQELNEKRRLRRAKKALDAEAKGLRKRRLNLRTRELLHKANGKPLAKELLEAAMIRMMALSLHYLPHDAQGNQRYREGEDGKKIPIGDYDRYIECTEAYAQFAAWLAPYQSPKLSAVAVTKAPQQTGGTFNSE